MALSYPHTATFDSNSKSLEFEDGLELTVPKDAFAEAVEITIDKSNDENSGQAVTAAYTFKTAGEPPNLGKELMLRVPPLVAITVNTALTFRDRDPGEEIPTVDSWTPRPDNPPGLPGDDGGKLDVKIKDLSTFQVVKD